MKIPQSGLKIDSPAFPLLQALISYWGITSANGAATGLTVVDAALANEPSYDGLPVKILTGPAAGQARTVNVHAGANLIVGVPFTNPAGGVQQITAGTLFVILSSLSGGGGPGPAPSEGLVYYGVVDAIAANQFTINALAGLGVGKFDGVNNPYFAFVLRTALGTGLAPQGEQQPITAYASATGTFTTLAFATAVAVGDEVLIVSPYLAAIGILSSQHSGALAFLGYCPPGMGASTNVISCPNLAYMGDNVFTRGYQMIVLRNANAVGNPPEMEMRDITNYGSNTGLFATAAFSAVVEENDIVLVIHNSVAAQISAYGIADAGSGVGIVRDAARTEADDWWNGQTVMMMSGAARGQKRPIADFIAATDDIIPAPNFDAAVAAGDRYIILAHYNMIVPRLADDGANALASDVIGRKDDTAVWATGNTFSIMRYLKGIITTVGGGSPDIAQVIGVFPFNESAAGEQTIFSAVVAARAKVGAVWLDLNTLTLNNTIRIKEKIDAVNYRTFSAHNWVFATDDKGVLLEGFTAYRDFQVTMQCAGGGAAGKNVPYAVV